MVNGIYTNCIFGRFLWDEDSPLQNIHCNRYYPMDSNRDTIGDLYPENGSSIFGTHLSFGGSQRKGTLFKNTRKTFTPALNPFDSWDNLQSYIFETNDINYFWGSFLRKKIDPIRNTLTFQLPRKVGLFKFIRVGFWGRASAGRTSATISNTGNLGGFLKYDSNFRGSLGLKVPLGRVGDKYVLSLAYK